MTLVDEYERLLGYLSEAEIEKRERSNARRMSKARAERIAGGNLGNGNTWCDAKPRQE